MSDKSSSASSFPFAAWFVFVGKLLDILWMPEGNRPPPMSTEGIVSGMSSEGLSLQQAKALFREYGLRTTGPRLAVINLMLQSQRPLSHNEVADALQNHGINYSTIFRALTEMAVAGLLRRLELGDHVWRYEATRSTALQSVRDHAHFLCTECGRIHCLKPDIWTDIGPDYERLIGQVDEVLYKGRCRDCVEGTRSPDSKFVYGTSVAGNSDQSDPQGEAVG